MNLLRFYYVIFFLTTVYIICIYKYIDQKKFTKISIVMGEESLCLMTRAIRCVKD